MIYFEPQAGLCNRMRSIESAYHIAKDLNTKLCIVWLCNNDCMAKFSELFQPIQGVEVIEVSRMFGMRATIHYQRWKTKRIMKHCMEVKKLGLCTDAKAVRESIRDKDVYIQSYSVWYACEQKEKLFKPVSQIQEAIDEKKKTFGDVCIGVHIRRTDNVVSLENSRTELFVQKMNKEIQKNPQVRFFVASDSDVEKKRMQKLFADRIVLNENIVLKRNSKIGMINAVIDLFLLASCNKILGSAGSSYSEVASEIGNIECNVVY